MIQPPTASLRTKMPVMAHLVLGYPTLAESLVTAETYIQAGIEILELQIPFSHPTADGPVITAACQQAVEQQGVTVEDCLTAIRQIRAQHPEQEIMVMSYINRVFAYGLKNFARTMIALNIKHLIIPDLPVDSALARQLTDFDPTRRLKLVPVLAANASDQRIETLLNLGFDFFYLMSDFKITGSSFSLHPRLAGVISRIKNHGIPAPRVGIGFGISTPAQAQLVTAEADIAIIGSALIQAQQAGTLTEYLQSLQDALEITTLQPS